MKLKETIRITGAAGYILLWLWEIPIPILLIIFLLRELQLIRQETS
jgi:hypothetical protein